jgi:hypothetical protein
MTLKSIRLGGLSHSVPSFATEIQVIFQQRFTFVEVWGCGVLVGEIDFAPLMSLRPGRAVHP